MVRSLILLLLFHAIFNLHSVTALSELEQKAYDTAARNGSTHKVVVRLEEGDEIFYCSIIDLWELSVVCRSVDEQKEPLRLATTQALLKMGFPPAHIDKVLWPESMLQFYQETQLKRDEALRSTIYSYIWWPVMVVCATWNMGVVTAFVYLLYRIVRWFYLLVKTFGKWLQRRTSKNELHKEVKMESSKPITTTPHGLPEEVSTKLPESIECYKCHHPNQRSIHPGTEAFYKLTCHNVTSHTVSVHKNCFRTTFGISKKRDLKAGGRCVYESCDRMLKCVYEVKMDLTENDELFLKWPAALE